MGTSISTSINSCLNQTWFDIQTESKITQLPDEILLQIVSYFNIHDLCFLIPKICKRFSRISRDNSIWQKFCSKEWPKKPKSETYIYFMDKRTG